MNRLLWQPINPEKSQLYAFMQDINTEYNLTLKDYPSLHQWSIDNPDLFWQAVVNFFNIVWHKKPNSIVHNTQNMLEARWFEGATFNIVERLLERQDEHPAIISITENNDKEVLSFIELRQQVANCAAALIKAGVKPQDRVAALMPNTANTIMALLATASIGALWSSCSPDFGVEALVDRLGQVQPTILFATDGHRYQGKAYPAQEKIAAIMQAIPSIQTVVVTPTLGDQTLAFPCIYWDDFLIKNATLVFPSFPFSHPLYIMFSSGTTGKPKCIVHGAGGTLLQHLKELGLHTNLDKDDCLLFYTTCGWMMWNWMLSALALGTTLVLYEGSPAFPTIGHLFEIIDEEQVTVFGTSAKFISTVEKEGYKPREACHLNTLKTILSTGSPLLTKNYEFVYQSIKPSVQLSSISGGTDIISCFALGNPLLPVYSGELQCLGLGMAVEVFNEQGESITGSSGELVCTKPFPSMPLNFWQDIQNKAYQKAYFSRFPNVWAHGDFATITEHQGLIIHGRSDAVLNPGGVRIGTAEIYRQIEGIHEIVNSVVIAQEWQDDVRIVLFVKLQPSLRLTDALSALIKQTIRQHTSPRHVPAKIVQVSDIPVTLSGKVVELAVRQVVHGLAITNKTSLANPEALKEYENRPELAD